MDAVLHVDMDEFIAAVEVLRRPELRGKPVVVGGDGDPTKRGVVSTANYEARAFGIGSAMPLRTAFKRNPDAVFLAVDAPAYLEASKRVMDVLRSFPAVVEVMGWDEAFMAVSADDPEALARVAWGSFIRAAKAIAEEGSFAGFDGATPFAELNRIFGA
jgi:DNA polymerase-4